MAHDNWYTPKEVIEPIRLFYGGSIDLDPASCVDANETVKAKKYFDGHRPIEKGGRGDGLVLSWFGDVFCNPPYCGKDTVKTWIGKAQKEFKEHRATSIVMLVNRWSVFTTKNKVRLTVNDTDFVLT